MGRASELTRALAAALGRRGGRRVARDGGRHEAALRDSLDLEARMRRAAALGAALPGLRIVGALGEGGMGRVYLAESDRGGRRVAVKVLRPELAASRDARHRFLREAEAARRVDHRNVVALLDARVVASPGGDLPVLVMEHAPGRTLRVRLDTGRPLAEPQVRRIGVELAAALAAIHAAGVVHRDVKPQNVVLGRQGAVKLLDLGAARLVDAATRLTRTGRFLGTLAYAAPEQLDPAVGPLDSRADLFALGVTLYEAATGHLPWRPCLEGAWTRDATLRVSDLVSGISDELDDAIARLLATRPDERPESAAAAARELSRRPRRGRGIASRARPDLSGLTPSLLAAERGEGAVAIVCSRRPGALAEFLETLARRLASIDRDWCVLRGDFDGAADAVCDAAAALSPGRQDGGGRWDARARAFAALDAIRRQAATRPVALLVQRLDLASAATLATFASLAVAAEGRAILVVAGCLDARKSPNLDGFVALPHVRRLDLDAGSRVRHERRRAGGR